MMEDSMAGISDQRYYFVALLLPRDREGVSWLWRRLEGEFSLKRGRFSVETSTGWTDLEFRTVVEASAFAGSERAREILAANNKGTRCAYDVFVGRCDGAALGSKRTGSVVALGTGYAALTGHLVGSLARKGLATAAWFLSPKLEALAAYVRSGSGGAGDRGIRMTMTGLDAFVPGFKEVAGLRLAGRDVYTGGLVDHIEGWYRNEAERLKSAGQEVKWAGESSPFRLQAVRLKCEAALTGHAVSLTMRRDGATKTWVRKDVASVRELGMAIANLAALRFFETTASPPRWCEAEF